MYKQYLCLEDHLHMMRCSSWEKPTRTGPQEEISGPPVPAYITSLTFTDWGGRQIDFPGLFLYCFFSPSLCLFWVSHIVVSVQELGVHAMMLV